MTSARIGKSYMVDLILLLVLTNISKIIGYNTNK